MTKLNWYYVKPFHTKYALFPTRKLLMRHYRKKNIAEPERLTSKVGAICSVLEGKDGSATVTVELGNMKDVPDHQALSRLAHEAVHVFQFACGSAGEEAPSAEFEAYSIQEIFGNLMHEYGVHRARVKKRGV